MAAQSRAMRTPLLVSISIAAASCAGARPSALPAPRPLPAGSSYTTARQGDVHDFDEFAGAWSFVNRRLKVRGVGSNDWDEFPALSCTRLYLDGVANVDEVYFPTKGWSGLTVRHFDLEKRQWSIYWINSRDGKMFPPVVGGFAGAIGEFYGEDTDGGHPVEVRFRWTKIDRDHLRWEQSFSSDGGVTWEMNWMNELTRTEPSACDEGRPRHSPGPAQ